jgi:rhodanese-related sulfurtransferase
MDTAISTESPSSYPAETLASRLGSADCPLVIDVRKAPAFDAAARCLPGALRIAADDITAAIALFRRERKVVAYCEDGREAGQEAAHALRTAGFDATHLQGGITAWEQAGLPTMARLPELGLPARPGHPTRWITRERPKIDRIACPWLIRRFIDPTAEFLYVPAKDVAAAAKRENAIPYDVPDVRFSHRGTQGELCSFDAFVSDCGLTDPCLRDLAYIVRGADTGKPELTPQSPGLLAISLGLSVNFSDDHAMLKQGMVIYDALYAWVKSARAEVHNADLFRKS